MNRRSTAERDAHDVVIREATEDDAHAVVELFQAVYGSTYMYPQFYEDVGVRKVVFDEDTLLLVAEAPDGSIVGTAGVLFGMGAYTDLVGEFGRLAVHPDWQSRGIGGRLMDARLERLGGRLHVAYVEARVAHPFSTRIAQSHGFVPVGLLPQKLLFGEAREHTGLMVRYFGDALRLRKNHPRIIPEVQYLAELATDASGVQPDVVVVEDATAYPAGRRYDLEELTEQGYSSLLRIERGRIRRREIFGPQRLQYGLFKLAASHSTYLVARDHSRIVGAIGYTTDEHEGHVRVFEVIHTEEDVVRFLLAALEERCRARGMMGVEIDVSADAPRMQRTVLEMGYLPAAYVPALAFHEVERVDVVKMYRLLGDLEELPLEAPEPMLTIGRHVLDQFASLQVLPQLARAMERLEICRGLTGEQSRRLLGEFQTRTYDAGEAIFGEGDSPEEMLLVLEGSATISVGGVPIGTVHEGESLGEVSLLNGTDHFASAHAQTNLEAGFLDRSRLDALVRRRPDIGTVVYRNLARGLGEKLRRADRAKTFG